MPACLPACLSVCLSVCMSVCLSPYLPACLLACLDVCLGVCLSVWHYLSACLLKGQSECHNTEAQANHVSLQIKVVGNWMCKIEGLIRRIVRLRQVAPEEKSLVFSQYPDALKLVGKALHVNNISWVQLKGGSKVTFCSYISNKSDTLHTSALAK